MFLLTQDHEGICRACSDKTCIYSTYVLYNNTLQEPTDVFDGNIDSAQVFYLEHLCVEKSTQYLHNMVSFVT